MKYFSLGILAALTAISLISVTSVAAEDAAPGSAPDDWIFLNNGQLRLGVIKSSGAAIGYLSRADSTKNLLNHYDRGRLIQQSYYGDADGSMWADKPWRLNPVQGGSYQGAVPKLLEVKTEGSQLYSKSIPLHWATGEPLEDFTMEQWIELRDEVVSVRFRMTYRGTDTHVPRHQEIPAVFLDASLCDLVFYEGETPWTGQPLVAKQPGAKNEYFDIPEHWAAFVDKNGFGLGVYVPVADRITCYRFQGGGGSDCSYLAPITTFAFQPGLAFEYQAYFCLGDVEEIREKFDVVRKAEALEK